MPQRSRNGIAGTGSVLIWFRRDLRLADNRALAAAIRQAEGAGVGVVPVFVLGSDRHKGDADAREIGRASRWWLHHSLTSLSRALEGLGSRLVLRRGEPHEVLADLAMETGARSVHFSRAYEPQQITAEMGVKSRFDGLGLGCHRHAGYLLREPEEVATGAGHPYKVFTPFWRSCLERGAPAAAIAAPRSLPLPTNWPASEALSDWSLTPLAAGCPVDWAKGFGVHWSPGEAGAQEKLAGFLDGAAKNYDEQRDRPDLPGTSRLSPHLHFGEISPAQAWHAAQFTADREPAYAKGIRSFQRELYWREFSAHLLFHFPTLPSASFRPEFDAYPWRSSRCDLRAWQRGRTGYPIVDAGMRELWQTGWMHNRVRMIVASFLIKDLLIDWRHGEAWFWDTLVDADLANNSASWQWVAGAGADAAPYFRIFNPVSQGRKFDPKGEYVRTFLPELAKLPDALVHSPWEASEIELKAAGLALPHDYPLPIVDHKEARAAALAGFAKVKAAKTGDAA